jgi:trimethylamine--corrinoid protein Co-methyltransferase
MEGGNFQPLGQQELQKMHETVLQVLEETGLSEASPSVVKHITSVGGQLGQDGRLRFPSSLVERALSEIQRKFTLYGQLPGHELNLSGKRVHMGSGGAAPSIVDLDTGYYRDSTLKDLYDAARLVDTLENIHFFSRSLVARDMPDTHSLDINTAYACLRGTSKHVCVSASTGSHAREIADMCFSIAGSKDAFSAQPFLSFNINHVTPPLRFSGDACDVIEQAALLGIPIHANVFGQVGASSPVSLAGSIVQSVSEVLAGMIFGWSVSPDAKMIFGAKPMITDLRTGGMSGGGGEQALVMAAATQMAQYYDLPNVSIAGASDSKIADAQSGYEKSLSVSLAAHAGSNLITQACGMQASLMGCALESYVIDNDMLGGILSSLRPLQINEETLSAKSIDKVVHTEGHFLGEKETMARMKSDFLYPVIADRRPPAEWEQDGRKEIRQVALVRTKEILDTHFPNHIDQNIDQSLRTNFDIRLSI